MIALSVRVRRLFLLLLGTLFLSGGLLGLGSVAEAALCDGTTTPCVEDPAIDNCVQCHSIKVQGGNRNGTDRFLTVSSSTNRHILGPRQGDWTADVNGMISKGAPGDAAKAAKTAAYLNTNYCSTCTGPILSSPTLSGITSTTVTVEWTTSGNAYGDLAATSCVLYGTSTTSLTGDTCNSGDPNYDPNNANLVTTHSVSLTGLTPLTKYYVVHRSSAAGNTSTYTLAATFTTPPGGGGGGGGGALGTIVSLAVGDYNNDAKVDLGVGVSTKNHVISYLGNGTGGFTKGQTLANVGTTPTSITSGGVKGDFNGDGLDDLAAANFGSKNVTVFLGTVSSGFQTTAVSSITVADPPTAVATGDFNGDGALDLAVATVMSDGSRGSVLIFTGVKDGSGNGTGNFTGPLTTLDIEVSTTVGPTISSITPNPVDCLGLPTDITITGTLLLEGLTVSLDGTLPMNVKSVSADSTTVVATVPNTATSGPHSVVVTVSGLPPASGNLTITPRTVTIDTVIPASRTYAVDPSGQVVIYGTNFVLGGEITIGTVKGITVAGTTASATTPFVFVNSGLVKVYLGSTDLPAGTYDVYYANKDGCAGVATLTGGFVVTAPQPEVTQLSPDVVTYGLTTSRSVTIAGANFVTGAHISVGGLTGTTVTGSSATVDTPFVFVSKTQLKFYWGNTAIAPGAHAVEVTNPSVAGGLTGSLMNGFTVVAPEPSVTSVSPTPVTYDVTSSQAITIFGANFLSGATITVGSISGATVPSSNATTSTPFAYVNSGQIKFYWDRKSLPPGTYNVQVTNPAASGGLMGTLAAGFTVAGAQPSITSVSPTPVTYGITGNSSITIFGDSFVLGATITVGSLSGTTVAGSTASATTPFVFVTKSQLKFWWPNTSLAPGTHDIQVTNTADSGGLSTTMAAAFTVTAPQPTLTNLSPDQVTYGISSSVGITVYGSNFVVGSRITVGSLTGVTVAGSTATASTPFVFVNSGQLKFYWPNTSLSPGVYAVQVANPSAAGALSASLAGAFTVAAPQPVVSFASPTPVTYGSNSIVITVYGSGFIVGATLTVGSLSGATVAASNASATTPFAFVSSGQLKFYWTGTALPVGSYAVSVVNPASAGSLSTSLADGFVVAAPEPAITLVSPTPVTYGTMSSRAITIYGSGFAPGATITVGTISGTTVNGSSATATIPFVFVNSGQVKFYWNNTSLPVGSYTVNVVNSSAAGGLAASLIDGFVVQ